MSAFSLPAVGTAVYSFCRFRLSLRISSKRGLSSVVSRLWRCCALLKPFRGFRCRFGVQGYIVPYDVSDPQRRRDVEIEPLAKTYNCLFTIHQVAASINNSAFYLITSVLVGHC